MSPSSLGPRYSLVGRARDSRAELRPCEAPIRERSREFEGFSTPGADRSGLGSVRRAPCRAILQGRLSLPGLPRLAARRRSAERRRSAPNSPGSCSSPPGSAARGSATPESRPAIPGRRCRRSASPVRPPSRQRPRLALPALLRASRSLPGRVASPGATGAVQPAAAVSQAKPPAAIPLALSRPVATSFGAGHPASTQRPPERRPRHRVRTRRPARLLERSRRRACRRSTRQRASGGVFRVGAVGDRVAGTDRVVGGADARLDASGRCVDPRFGYRLAPGCRISRHRSANPVGGNRRIEASRSARGRA